MKYSYKPFPLSYPDPVIQIDYAWRPALNVFISQSGRRSAPVQAIVDTGADHSVFDAGIAEAIGIQIPQEKQVSFSGVGKGPETTGYLHTVTLTVAAQTYEAPIIFAYDLSLMGVLGQIGFFNQFIVTFDWTPHPPCFDVQRIARN